MTKGTNFTRLDSFYIFSGLVTLSALLIDSYKSSGTFQKYFFVKSSTVLFIFLIFSLYLNLKNYSLPRVLKLINNWVIFPITLLTTVGLSLWDYLTPVNYVFEKYAINYERLGIITLGSFILIFINQGNHWWKRHWKKLIFLSAFIIFSVYLLLRIWPFDFFLNLVLEDHFVEWAQFWVILFSSLIAFITAKRFWNTNKLLALVYIALALGTIFIAGDEISWGQRILGFETPGNIQVVNDQNEFNIHNLSTFGSIIWYLYLSLNFLGAFGWLIDLVVSKKYRYLERMIVPQWHVSSFFLIAFIYHLFSNPATPTHIREWAEPAELMMYLGIFFFVLSSFLQVNKKVSED